jgi:hypothetical protein
LVDFSRQKFRAMQMHPEANVSHKRSSRGHFVDRQLQKSLNAKRSVVIGQHETGVSLEAAFWKGFTEIAAMSGCQTSPPRSTKGVILGQVNPKIAASPLRVVLPGGL